MTEIFFLVLGGPLIFITAWSFAKAYFDDVGYVTSIKHAGLKENRV